MRCRSTKEAGELVERVMPEVLRAGNSKLDHAAIAMVRSRWWETLPERSNQRGHVKVMSARYQHAYGNELSGAIPWR